MHLLLNQASPIQILKKPSFPFSQSGFSVSPPQYHYDYGNFVFITGQDAIFKYNLDRQNIVETHKFPSSVNDQIGHFDPKTGIFYVIDEYAYWMTFDSNTKQWDTSFFEEPVDDDSIAPITTFVHIPAPIDQLHFIQDDSHYMILDGNEYSKDDEGTFAEELASNIELKPWTDDQYEVFYRAPKLVYNSRDNELIMLQQGCDHILICRIYDENQESYKWRKANIKLKSALPHYREFEAILGWNQMLFVFNLESWFIECIDLKHPEIGSYTQDIGTESLVKNELTFNFVVKDIHHDVHFLKLNISDADDDKVKSCHFRVSLFDLIPWGVLKRNRKDWEIVVIGYCKQCEKKEKMSFVPDSLKNLILQFYPIFV